MNENLNARILYYAIGLRERSQQARNFKGDRYKSQYPSPSKAPGIKPTLTHGNSTNKPRQLNIEMHLGGLVSLVGKWAQVRLYG